MCHELTARAVRQQEQTCLIVIFCISHRYFIEVAYCTRESRNRRLIRHAPDNWDRGIKLIHTDRDTRYRTTRHNEQG